MRYKDRAISRLIYLNKVEARLNIVISCKIDFGLCLNETMTERVLFIVNIDVDWLRADMLWHERNGNHICN